MRNKLYEILILLAKNAFIFGITIADIDFQIHLRNSKSFSLPLRPSDLRAKETRKK